MLLISASAHAEFYKYIGPGGEILFTDNPAKGSYKLLWKKQNVFVVESPDGSSTPSSTNQASSPNHVSSAAVPNRIRFNEITMAAPKPAKKLKPQLDVRSTHTNRARYSDMIDEIARKARLYPELVHAVIKAESAYDPNAVSRAGAIGLMQLMPQTARRFGVKNSRNPRQNVEGGTTYLRQLLTRYNNNVKLALAAYNAGEKAVKKYGNKIPPYRETQNYVKKVLAFYKKNRKQLAAVN